MARVLAGRLGWASATLATKKRVDRSRAGWNAQRIGSREAATEPLCDRSAHQSWRGWTIQTECAACSAPVLPAGWLSRTSMDMDHPWEEKLPWEDGFA